MWLLLHKNSFSCHALLVIPNLISLSLSLLPLLKINKGFQKDEFKVQVDNCGKLTIRGRRPLGDSQYMRLEQVFDVPKDSHMDKIRGKFEDSRLSLFMPKKVVAEKETQRAVSWEPPEAAPVKKEEAQIPKDQHKEKPSTDQKETPAQQVNKLEEYKKKALALKVKLEELEGWLDYGLMDGLLETISKNKTAIAVATVAFTAGFYISRKLRSS